MSNAAEQEVGTRRWRSGCEVGQGVDEVDAAGELISVI
jgi:hypothetical protein